MWRWALTRSRLGRRAQGFSDTTSSIARHVRHLFSTRSRCDYPGLVSPHHPRSHHSASPAGGGPWGQRRRRGRGGGSSNDDGHPRPSGPRPPPPPPPRRRRDVKVQVQERHNTVVDPRLTVLGQTSAAVVRTRDDLTPIPLAASSQPRVTIDRGAVPLDLTKRRQLYDHARDYLGPLDSEAKLELFRELLLGNAVAEYPFAVTAMWERVAGRSDLGTGDLILAAQPVSDENLATLTQGNDTKDDKIGARPDAAPPASHIACTQADDSRLASPLCSATVKNGQGVHMPVPNDILCIEIAHLDYESESKSSAARARRRNNKRNQCKKRLEASMQHWLKHFPHDRVLGATVYNYPEQMYTPTLPPYQMVVYTPESIVTGNTNNDNNNVLATKPGDDDGHGGAHGAHAVGGEQTPMTCSTNKDDPAPSTGKPQLWAIPPASAVAESLFRVSEYLRATQELVAIDREERKMRAWLADKVAQVFTGHQEQGENEMRLIFTLLQQYSIKSYPYAVEAEWEYTPGFPNHGRGDLVFSDTRHVQFHSTHKPCRVLIVECKYLDYSRSGRSVRERRRAMKRKVELQTRNSVLAWKEAHPQDQVRGLVFTNINPFFLEVVDGGGLEDSDGNKSLAAKPLSPMPSSSAAEVVGGDRDDPGGADVPWPQWPRWQTPPT